MNSFKRRLSYLLSDFIASELVWVVFYIFRKKILEPQKFGEEVPLEFTLNFFLGLLLIPFVWMLLFSMAGFYQDVFRRSRLKELTQSILFTLIGSLILFFALMLDDEVADYTFYLPYDSAKNAKRVEGLFKPVMAVWVKYDFWFYFLYQLKNISGKNCKQ